jgi:tRNA(Ile)-lysidine synthase
MLLDHVRKTILQNNLIRKGDTVVIGVSGGPDSMALLYLLSELKVELALEPVVAHVDHMLRRSAKQDASFVKIHAQKLGLPFFVTAIDIKSLACRGSVEEIARNARLAFLSKIALKVRATAIALGHTLDDQAETVLMRIIRGAGLYGLQAIVPKRALAGCVIVRPLIETSRSDVEKYLQKKGIEPRIDRSNFSDAYLRNKIRLQLLPLIEKRYNSNIKLVLAHMAETVGMDYDYLIRSARQKQKGWLNRIPLKKLLQLHPAISRLILRMAFARAKGDLRTLTFRHIKEIEAMLISRPVNSIVDLPKNISVAKKKNHLLFYRR